MVDFHISIYARNYTAFYQKKTLTSGDYSSDLTSTVWELSSKNKLSLKDNLPLGPRKAGKIFPGGAQETHVTRVATKRLLSKPRIIYR